MGLERITDSLIAAYGHIKEDLSKDKVYLAAAGAYVASRIMDGYMTHLAYHTFEEVGEKNDYIDFMVRQLGTPDGLIIGMGIPSIAAIILAKVLNDRFSWTKHWGTAALAIMAGISLFGAYNNMSLYLQNI